MTNSQLLAAPESLKMTQEELNHAMRVIPCGLTLTEMLATGMPHKGGLHQLAEAEWLDVEEPALCALRLSPETRARLRSIGLGPPGPWKVTLEQARKCDDVLLADSFTRLPAVIGLARRMQRADWLQLLGEQWQSCDNVTQHKRILSRWLKPFHTAPEMMTTEELERFNALPDRVEIYRGCGLNNTRGICWTLDRATAERFPALYRYRQEGPAVLVTANVRKKWIVALKLGRQEAEIITFKTRRLSLVEIALPSKEKKE
jgi:hypothetical protein